VPLVVSSTVALWITTRRLSLVDWMSSSIMSEPTFTARLNAYIVFVGASRSPPECAMFSTRCSSQSTG
jgi:hypothetical protein